uniref:Cation/H+ exchanger transmembrane domain-containing protein n=1 Tax=Zea mays TaxID=4577 RepID=A0A804PMR0_MAIZE
MGDEAKCSVDVAEGAYIMASIMAVSGIMVTVLVLSALFHFVLRRLGQPSVISHILAGIVVGPTVLGRAMDLRQLGMRDAGDALGGTIYFVRMVFMFFIGLELDLRYLRRNLRRSLVVACGGSGFCFVLAVLTGPFTYGFLHPGQGHFQPSNIYASTALFAIVITSTASPVLIRIVTELKLSGSETGQIAIGAAFANDMASLTALSVIVVTHTLYGTMPNEKESSPPAKVAVVAWMALTVWMAVNLAAWVARMLNRLKRGRQYISKYELCALHATLLRGHRCSPRLCQDRQVHGGPARRGRHLHYVAEHGGEGGRHLAGGAGAGNRDPRGRRAGCAAQRQGLL